MIEHKIQLTEDHDKALSCIHDDAYKHEGLSDMIMEMIEDYILREDGRLGRFDRGLHYEEAV